MRRDAQRIIERSIADVMPDKGVRETLHKLDFNGRVFIVAIGKAAWGMARISDEILGEKLYKGIIVTKYGHSQGDLGKFEIIESGHPTPDENSIIGAKRIIALMEEVSEHDTVLMLLSGGGSSLVELPVDGVTLDDIQDTTRQLLFSKADITEINTIRKKLSSVKGGKFSRYIGQAKAYAIILSDILGDNNAMIASGLTYTDASTAADAVSIVEKYGLKLRDCIYQALLNSTPYLDVNIENHVIGSVKELCLSAAKHAEALGYTSKILTTSLSCEAKEAGRWIASLARQDKERPLALIAGGETVVEVVGTGLGGRNQEIALSAAMELKGMKDVLLFSIGSDGTDGPTEAAGGIVDGTTVLELEKLGIDCEKVLSENDSYHALKAVNGLVITGATGTNVNDVTVLLCK